MRASVPRGRHGYLDMRPSVEYAEQTKYWMKHSTPTRGTRRCRRRCSDRGSATGCSAISGAGAGDRVVDSAAAAGARCCGTRTGGATTVGIDISPFFAEEARARSRPAARGPAPAALRRRHVRQGLLARRVRALSPEALPDADRGGARAGARRRAVRLLARPEERVDCARVCGVSSASRDGSRVWGCRRAPGAAAQVGSSQPAARHPELEQVARESGFRIASIRFYTPLVGGLVENIVMRMAERAMARRAAQPAGRARPAEDADREAIREARSAAKRRIASGPATYGAARSCPPR